MSDWSSHREHLLWRRVHVVYLATVLLHYRDELRFLSTSFEPAFARDSQLARFGVVAHWALHREAGYPLGWRQSRLERSTPFGRAGSGATCSQRSPRRTDSPTRARSWSQPASWLTSQTRNRSTWGKSVLLGYTYGHEQFPSNQSARPGQPFGRMTSWPTSIRWPSGSRI